MGPAEFCASRAIRPAAIRCSSTSDAARFFFRDAPGLFMPLRLGPGNRVAIGFEPEDGRRERCVQLVAAALEEGIDGPPSLEEQLLLLFVRGLGLSDVHLALGHEIGRGGRVLLTLDRIGDPCPGELEVAKAVRKIGVALGEPGVEPPRSDHRPGG